MITVVTKDIGKEYHKIDSMYRQVWGHPNFSLMRASQAEVARMRSDNSINNDVVNIMKFLRDAKFATADQISRGTNLNVTDKVMDDLYNNLFVNMFVLSDLDDRGALDEKEALKIYTLDFGGDYLLSIEAVDMTNWRYTQYFASAQLVAKALQQVEVLINLIHSKGLTLREYDQFNEFRAGDKLVKTDFDFSVISNTNEQVVNFIGYFLEPGFEDLYFRDSADILNLVFKITNSWMRYYPLGQEYKPKLLLVIRDSTDIKQITRTANIVGQATDFVGQEVYIVGYNDIITKGLGNSKFFSLGTGEDEDGKKQIKVGTLTTEIFK